MAIGVINEKYRLNPDDAVCMNQGDLFALAKGECRESLRDGSVYMLRIPRDATEAGAMLRTMTIFSDVTKPVARSKTPYAPKPDTPMPS